MKIPDDMKNGNVIKTKEYGEIEITYYNSNRDVGILFLRTGNEVSTRADVIREGRIKDRMQPSVFGVGFIGVGKYNSGTSKNKDLAYSRWISMMQRCYSDLVHKKHPTYIGCTVCDEWHNYQVFAEWFHENKVSGMQLDKDIKVDGNKVYSPSTCLFVSSADNTQKASAKNYSFISPDGVLTKFYGLNKFCRNNGLSAGNMVSVNNGTAKHHKGWTKA